MHQTNTAATNAREQRYFISDKVRLTDFCREYVKNSLDEVPERSNQFSYNTADIDLYWFSNNIYQLTILSAFSKFTIITYKEYLRPNYNRRKVLCLFTDAWRAFYFCYQIFKTKMLPYQIF